MKIAFNLIILLSLFFALPGLSLAEETEPKSTGLSKTITNNYQQVASFAKLYETDAEKISPLDIVGLFFNLTVAFTGVIFLIQVIHGGLLWMTAGGNEEQVTKARSKIVNGTIGVAIVFSAYIFVFFVLSQITSLVGLTESGFSVESPQN